MTEGYLKLHHKEVCFNIYEAHSTGIILSNKKVAWKGILLTNWKLTRKEVLFNQYQCTVEGNVF